MPKITIDLTDSAIAQLDVICAKSGYTRSEQIDGMIAAEADISPVPLWCRGRVWDNGDMTECGRPAVFGDRCEEHRSKQ